MTKQLFRQEAIDAQREKFFGETVDVRPLSMWTITLLAVVAAAVMLSVGVWGQYTRRERVEGLLSLDVGVARVLVREAGRVSALDIKEGQIVRAGMPMGVIAFDRSTTQSSSTAEAITGELGQRRASLEREQLQLQSLGASQIQQIRKRVVDIQGEMAQLDSETKLQEQRLTSVKEQAKRFSDLGKEKFVSDVVVRQKQDEVTEQEIRVQSMKRQRATLERDLSAAKLDEPTAQLRMRSQIGQVDRQISELQQNLAQEDSKRESVIRAPIDGIATNIAVNVGESVAADTLFATIVPKGSALRAELLVPTRAIGFVTKGREVSLRYEAFPFERFGQYRGVVSEVSQTVWSPGEKIGALVVREPVYRVIVTLDRQTVTALDQEIALRPGMLINADILLEKRSLLAWIFEPILQLRGRL